MAAAVIAEDRFTSPSPVTSIRDQTSFISYMANWKGFVGA
jgi:hypothetical protein